MKIKLSAVAMTTIITLISLLLISCAKEAPIVIEPGKFGEEWPTAIRGKLVRNKRCFVDAINGQSAAQTVHLRRGERIEIAGWAFSDDVGAPQDTYVQLVGPALTYTALTRTRVQRPDVNQYFKLDAQLITGFQLQATQNIEVGDYEVEIWQADAAGKQVAQCDSNAKITIN